MLSLRAFIPIIASITAAWADGPPLLFQSKFVERGSEQKLEHLIAECRKMPAQDAEEIAAWLETDAAKKGETATPMLPAPASFIFQKPSSDRCFIVAPLANLRHVLVHTGKIGIDGNVTVDMSSFRCVENEHIAQLLFAQVALYYPKGKKAIDEVQQLIKEALAEKAAQEDASTKKESPGK